MAEVFRPGGEEELAEAVANAAADKAPIEVFGGGSLREVGRPLQTASVLSTAELTGITLYEPSELVLSARAGTPVREIEKTLADEGQQLAFEPMELAGAFGGGDTLPTIGAVFATNLSGPRRILVGAARDHFIGMRGVNGRGETFKSGGRVMKNVTGYDLARALAGSWGTLAVMSEVTMKVLPRAEETRTLLLTGLTDDIAVEAMCAAMGLPYEVSGAVHLQAELAAHMSDKALADAGESVTALRLENFSASVAYRAERLMGAIGAFGNISELDDARSETFWRDIRSLAFLKGSDSQIWRLSVPPDRGAKVVAAITAHMDCQAAYDWSGGLIWLAAAPSKDAGVTEIRRAVAMSGGHATLLRAEPAVRAAIDVFQPLEATAAMLSSRIKTAFDPDGILNPGRMYPGV